MDMLEFILEDNYELFLNSISENSLDNIIQIINDVFFEKCNSKHENADYNLFVIMERVRWFIINYRSRKLRNYVNHENFEYLKSVPCFDCAENLPCVRCGVITPFDIFKIDTATNRMFYSCRPGLHHCPGCFAKKGLPKRDKRLTENRVRIVRERDYITKTKINQELKDE